MSLHYKNELDFIYFDYEGMFDVKYLVINNTSRYMNQNPTPSLFVTCPGELDPVELLIPEQGVFVINSGLLKQTQPFEDYVNLLDGIYKLRLSVCPHDREYVEKSILRTHAIKEKIADLVASIDFYAISADLSSELQKVYMANTMLFAASISCKKGATARGLELYRVADELVTQTQNVLKRYQNG